ncbi:glycosyltransferase [Sphaerisporangium sp. NPDC051017]|uniref:glycosyltransferase n=1 Tax=Sphaerisporangium sp. NPDC051017 TaxID=3154636 RepID=UPI003446C97F
MRVLLSTYGSRGGVEPLVGLAARLRALGAEVRVCAPPDEEFAQRLAGDGVPMAPFGWSARALTTGTPPPSPEDLPRRAAELIAGRLDAVTAAAEGCDALVATGMLPAVAGVRSVAEKLGIRYVHATFQQLTLPSPHHPSTSGEAKAGRCSSWLQVRHAGPDALPRAMVQATPDRSR